MILLAILAVLAVPASIASAQGFVPKPAPDPTTTTESLSDISGEPVRPVVPVTQVPPVIAPAPGLGVQALLLKHVRKKIVLYRKAAWRWQHLIGMKLSPGGNLWNLGSLANGNKLLETWQSRSHRLHQAAKKVMRQRINRYRQDIDHMSLVMGVRHTRTLLSSGNLERQFVHARRAWRTTRQRFSNPPYESSLMCVHGGEGAWNANTGNSYYGGLQMDLSFQSSYGGYLLRTKGTANHWTPLEQIWVAVRAINSGRGFYPWPNTARACGLI